MTGDCNRECCRSVSRLSIILVLERSCHLGRQDGIHRRGWKLDTDIDLGAWDITHDATRRYLASVGDKLSTYWDAGLAPPLFLAAGALGRLLEKMRLPPGAVHTLQEIETVEPVPLGQTVRGHARLEAPRQRGGLRFVTAAFTVSDEADRPLLRGKSTVLTPSETEAGTND